MTQMSGKDTTVSVTLPEPVYRTLEQSSTNRGMSLTDYVTSLLVTHTAVSVLDGVAVAVTNKKPKPPMKDPIIFLRKNLEKANPFTARLSDTTTIAIPVGVPMNIYDLLVDTEVCGYRDNRVSDIFDGKHCRINAIVNKAGGSYDIQYTKYQVVPIRNEDKDLYIWDVMTGFGTFPPSEYFVRCRVILNIKTGVVNVHTSDEYTAGIMMQFRFK